MPKDLRRVTIETYDNSAAELAEYFAGIGPRTEFIEQAFELAGSPKDPKVLEIGCGDGRDAVEVCKSTEQYIGMDVSKELIKIARQRLPGVRFDVGDIATYAYPANLDIVLSFASLLHSGKSEVQLVFKEVAKVLRSGGIFYISSRYKPEYAEEVETDRFGTRLFYYYNADAMIELAGPEYEVAVVMPPRSHSKRQWFELALRRV